ncbi:MAG: glycosyltransferase family 2 protein [Chthoniobacteraceae bacterium]
MPPLVSILIPAFNAEEFIADTLDSAIEQTWSNKEIVVVDDGSTDGTLAVAKRYEGRGVTVVRQKNQGAASTRNNLLALSKGDYIQWLDADDLLSKDKIECQLKSVGGEFTAKHLLSSPWAYFSYRASQARFTRTSLWNDLAPVEWLVRKMGENLHMQTATWLTSRELVDAAGPWDTRLLSDDDGEYFCRVLLASSGVKFVPEGRVYYRVTPTSRLSHIGQSDRKMDAMVISMRLHIKYIRSLEESERVRQACLNYLHTWLIHFYPERPDIVRELEALALEFGGRLEMPRLRWKYRWMVPAVGYDRAKRAQFVLPNLKASLLRRLDKLQFHLEKRLFGRC